MLMRAAKTKSGSSSTPARKSEPRGAGLLPVRFILWIPGFLVVRELLVERPRINYAVARHDLLNELVLFVAQDLRFGVQRVEQVFMVGEDSVRHLRKNRLL